MEGKISDRVHLFGLVCWDIKAAFNQNTFNRISRLLPKYKNKIFELSLSWDFLLLAVSRNR
jgi:hypothetical protein